MKIKIQGEWTLAQIRQCIFEQLLKIEERYDIPSARSVTLYITLTDERGRKAICKNAIGGEIDTIFIRDPGRYPDKPSSD